MSKRCIIPLRDSSNGSMLGKKDPMVYFSHENDILSVAGVFNDWIAGETGEEFVLFQS